MVSSYQRIWEWHIGKRQVCDGIIISIGMVSQKAGQFTQSGSPVLTLKKDQKVQNGRCGHLSAAATPVLVCCFASSQSWVWIENHSGLQQIQSLLDLNDMVVVIVVNYLVMVMGVGCRREVDGKWRNHEIHFVVCSPFGGLRGFNTSVIFPRYA